MRRSRSRSLSSLSIERVPNSSSRSDRSRHAALHPKNCRARARRTERPPTFHACCRSMLLRACCSPHAHRATTRKAHGLLRANGGRFRSPTPSTAYDRRQERSGSHRIAPARKPAHSRPRSSAGFPGNVLRCSAGASASSATPPIERSPWSSTSKPNPSSRVTSPAVRSAAGPIRGPALRCSNLNGEHPAAQFVSPCLVWKRRSRQKMALT